MLIAAPGLGKIGNMDSEILILIAMSVGAIAIFVLLFGSRN